MCVTGARRPHGEGIRDPGSWVPTRVSKAGAQLGALQPVHCCRVGHEEVSPGVECETDGVSELTLVMTHTQGRNEGSVGCLENCVCTQAFHQLSTGLLVARFDLRSIKWMHVRQ